MQTVFVYFSQRPECSHVADDVMIGSRALA